MFFPSQLRSREIYIATDAITNKSFALKVHRDCQWASALFDRESAILETLPPHPNIPRFFGKGTIGKLPCIVIEYLPYPSLESLLERQGVLDEAAALYILKQLVRSPTSENFPDISDPRGFL